MDATDRAIVACLVEDGRSTYQTIGSAVGLSVAAAKRRVDRLRSSGVIVGFTAVVDPQRFGRLLEAHVELSTRGHVTVERMRKDLMTMSEVVEAYSVAGNADALLRVVTEDTGHLEAVIAKLRGLDYVQQTTTTLLLTPLVPRTRSVGRALTGAWPDAT